MGDSLQDKFIGSMLGTFVGDALGMPVEGKSSSYIEKNYKKIDKMLPARLGKGTYTDDTQMMISLAESIIRKKGFNGKDVAKSFLKNFDPKRGYGRGTKIALSYIKKGVDWKKAGNMVFQGGSFGNGAAMRIAPVGLLYYNNFEKLKKISYKSSSITHSHPLGKEATAIMSAAIGLLVEKKNKKELNKGQYLQKLINFTKEDIFIHKLQWIKNNIDKKLSKQKIKHKLGVDSQSFNSVPTAIYSFLKHFYSFKATLIYAVSLGGDTDTIGAMSGALSGAFLGKSYIPKEWLNDLENNKKGKDYVIKLAKNLYNLKIKEGI